MTSKISAAAIRDFAEHLAVVAEAGNLEEVAKFYDPEATVWFNTTGITRKIAEHLAAAGKMRADIKSPRWVDLHITPFDNGYVQQHRVTSIGSDNQPREVAICMIFHIHNGKVIRREQYHDAAQLAALRE